MSRFAMFTFILCGFLNPANAAIESCGAIKAPYDFLRCLTEKQDIYKNANLLSEAESEMRASGSRWVNPQFQGQGLGGKTLGNDRLEIQGALLQTIQTGGKREAQKLLAEGEALAFRSMSLQERGQIARRLVMNLHRYRQLGLEIEAITEAVETFKKLVTQYNSRPRLLPEQEVSLSIFRIAASDYELRLLQAKNEEREVINFLRALLGVEVSQSRGALPQFCAPKKAELESFNEKRITENAPSVLGAQADFLKAKSAKSAARGDAFSDISFGPMIGINRDGGMDETLFGVMINIPFPIWNQNGYAVAALEKDAMLKESKAELVRRETQQDIVRMNVFLSEAIGTLERLPGRDSIQKKHIAAENQFFRGLVTPALMIETHRAIVDFMVQRHQIENQVTDLLWSLYVMDNRIDDKIKQSSTGGVCL